MEEELEELRATLEQVHKDSREIEAELEAEIRARDEAYAELEKRLQLALADSDQWKSQCTSLQKHSEKLEIALRATQNDLEELKSRIHSLETENDDMELNSRVSQGNVESLQAENQRLLESLALKEVDVVYHQQLTEEFQHTKDELAEAQEEIRNLQNALSIRETDYPPTSERIPEQRPSQQRISCVIDQEDGLPNQAKRISHSHTQPQAIPHPRPSSQEFGCPTSLHHSPPEHYPGQHSHTHPHRPKQRHLQHQPPLPASTSQQHIPPQLGGSLHPTKLRSSEWVLMDLKPSKVNTSSYRPLSEAGKISQGRGHGLANR